MEKPFPEPEDEPFSLEIPARCVNLRVDQFLALNFEEYSRSQLSQALRSGQIRVNGAVVKAGYRVKPGDQVSGAVIAAEEIEIPEPWPVDFAVVYEDDQVLVIDKPPGLVVHPGSGNPGRTLVNGLLHRYRDLEGVGDRFRPGIVHRLDKDTSGVMVVARSRAAHGALVGQFKDRRVEKTYLALIHGVPKESGGRIVAPIGRHPVHRQKMAIREEHGRYAVSNWKCREMFAAHTLVEVRIETGRTHQIRVHLAGLGHPVAGDRLYGPARDNRIFSRQMLHSWKLTFVHPGTGARLEAVAEPAEDFKQALARLRGGTC